MPLFPEREAQASFLKETMVKRERTERTLEAMVKQGLVEISLNP